MAHTVCIIFEGMGAEDYWRVSRHVGVTPDGHGELPKGSIAHTATVTPDGLLVCEAWESAEDADAFFASTLGPAFAAEGIPEPKQIIRGELLNVLRNDAANA